MPPTRWCVFYFFLGAIVAVVTIKVALMLFANNPAYWAARGAAVTCAHDRRGVKVGTVRPMERSGGGSSMPGVKRWELHVECID